MAIVWGWAVHIAAWVLVGVELYKIEDELAQITRMHRRRATLKVVLGLGVRTREDVGPQRGRGALFGLGLMNSGR